MEHRLEPDAGEMKELISQATDKIIEYLENIEKQPPYDITEVRKQAAGMVEKMPEEEKPFRQILDDLFSRDIPNGLHAPSPGYMAYIPGGGLFHSALAEFIARTANRYIGLDFSAPYLSQIESNVIRWFNEIVGYPSTSRGILTSGGSIANLTAIICARTKILGNEISKGTAYASSFAHHSISKAFHAAGIFKEQVREIPVDKQFRIDLTCLENEIKKDVEKGLKPFFIMGNAGSTNTGTIDPLRELHQISKKNNMWYHIDAAYGGFFAITERGKKKLDGLSHADSITMDPHKGLFLPYGTGALLVKDTRDLQNTFGHEADYIPQSESNIDLWSFADMSLELTRPFRGLGVWLPFKMLGADVFRKALQEKLDLSDYFIDKLTKNPAWEIVAQPDLSLSAFRYSVPGKNEEELNELNNKILDHVNDKFRVHLSGTIVNGKFVIRNCLLSFRTHKKHVDWVIEDLNNALREVTS